MRMVFCIKLKETKEKTQPKPTRGDLTELLRQVLILEKAGSRFNVPQDGGYNLIPTLKRIFVECGSSKETFMSTSRRLQKSTDLKSQYLSNRALNIVFSEALKTIRRQLYDNENAIDPKIVKSTLMEALKPRSYSKRYIRNLKVQFKDYMKEHDVSIRPLTKIQTSLTGQK